MNNIKQALISGSFNRVYLIRRGDEKLICKHYSTLERYKTEILFNNFFRKEGIVCPRIVNIDRSSRCIFFRHINGRKISITASEDVETVLKKISEIEKKSQIFDLNANFVRKKMTNFLVKILLKSLVKNKIEYLVNLFIDRFSIELFVDTQPSNWLLLGKNKLYLLDLDYVKCSCRFINICQFLSYLLIDEFDLFDQYIEKYFKYCKIASSKETLIHMYLLMLFSNNKKITYSHNKWAHERLTLQNNDIFLKINSIT